MSRPQRPVADDLDREKVAYWYFRLNGFLRSKTSSFIQKDAVVSEGTLI